MTLVCVRLDESYSTPRLTALADTRASAPRDDGSRKTISDTTAKLFAIPVRCYAGDCLSPVIGAWHDPYSETMIGLGFSGSCFEALTIVAHIKHLLGALMAPNGDQPLPCKNGLVGLIAKTTETYFESHSGDGNPLVRMVGFGFDDRRPWIGKISWDSKERLRSEVNWANVDALVSVGETSLFEQYTNDWRRLIQRHKAKLASSIDGDAGFEYGKAVADHDLADKKVVEEEMLRQIESEFAEGIGGVLQRLELGLYEGKVVAGFTRDDRPYMEGASDTVADKAVLVPVPIVEKMGRRIRNPRSNG